MIHFINPTALSIQIALCYLFSRIIRRKKQEFHDELRNIPVMQINSNSNAFISEYVSFKTADV